MVFIKKLCTVGSRNFGSVPNLSDPLNKISILIQSLSLIEHFKKIQAFVPVPRKVACGAGLFAHTFGRACQTFLIGGVVGEAGLGLEGALVHKTGLIQYQGTKALTPAFDSNIILVPGT